MITHAHLAGNPRTPALAQSEIARLENVRVLGQMRSSEADPYTTILSARLDGADYLLYACLVAVELLPSSQKAVA